MIDHEKIDRHFAVELFCEAAKRDITRLARAHIETSNRSFSQMARRIRERMEQVMVEQENMGDDAVGCGGIGWGGV